MKLIPEWYEHQSCFIAWPCNNELYGEIIFTAKQEVLNIINEISKTEKVIVLCNKEDLKEVEKNILSNNVKILECNLDDSWMRDIAPIFLIEDEKLKSVNFKFNGYGKYLNFLNDNKVSNFISNYLNKISNVAFPEKQTFHANLIRIPRYGENPHQKSAVYSKNSTLTIKQIHGKQLSYNNYNDIFAALTISKSLPKNKGTVIVKHTNPCGVSIKKNHLESYISALECDPVSAFGGIVSCNYKVNKTIAKELSKLFLEVIIANNFDADAIKILKEKKNIRLIDASNYTLKDELKFTSNNDEILVQSEDSNTFNIKDFKVVSKRKPSQNQMKNLIFAFNICRYVKSNAIVLVTNETTAGIGSGQPSRLDSCQIAIDKMNKFVKIKDDVVAASDAFFPFVDGIEKLVQSGVTAVIQPSGSIRDKEIIKFANETNTILVFSKTRHFRH